MTNQHKYLHELVKEQERNQRIAELVEALEPDPWRYSEPPAPFPPSQSMQLGQGPY